MMLSVVFGAIRDSNPKIDVLKNAIATPKNPAIRFSIFYPYMFKKIFEKISAVRFKKTFLV